MCQAGRGASTVCEQECRDCRQATRSVACGTSACLPSPCPPASPPHRPLQPRTPSTLAPPPRPPRNRLPQRMRPLRSPWTWPRGMSRHLSTGRGSRLRCACTLVAPPSLEVLILAQSTRHLSRSLTRTRTLTLACTLTKVHMQLKMHATGLAARCVGRGPPPGRRGGARACGCSAGTPQPSTACSRESQAASAWEGGWLGVGVCARAVRAVPMAHRGRCGYSRA